MTEFERTFQVREYFPRSYVSLVSRSLVTFRSKAEVKVMLSLLIMQSARVSVNDILPIEYVCAGKSPLNAYRSSSFWSEQRRNRIRRVASVLCVPGCSPNPDDHEIFVHESRGKAESSAFVHDHGDIRRFS